MSALRARAMLALLMLVAFVPVYVLWFGLPVLWQDWAGDVRLAWLTVVRGRTGPYPGVTW